MKINAKTQASLRARNIERADWEDAVTLQQTVRAIRKGGSMPVADTDLNANRIRSLARRYPATFGNVRVNKSEYIPSGSGSFGRQSLIRSAYYPATVSVS